MSGTFIADKVVYLFPFFGILYKKNQPAKDRVKLTIHLYKIAEDGMRVKVIKKKTYQIEYRNNLYSISLKEDEEGLVLDLFQPPEFEKFFDKDIRESEDEFLKIWFRYIIGLSACEKESDLVDRNIGALTFVTMDHLEQNGKVYFETLLKQMECFCSSLHSQGVPTKEIKKIYLPVLKGLLVNFLEKIYDKETGLLFHNSPYYKFLMGLR